jgi:hypothetical protein
VSELDDGLDERLGVAVARDIAHERAVDLEDVDREIAAG